VPATLKNAARVTCGSGLKSMARIHASRARPVSIVTRLNAGALRASIADAVAADVTRSGMPSVQ
jgi:hypothetical protein